ncbi:peptide MFS transporter [Fluviicola taffensis]|uniref:Amino acid/peptide transporter n=1 Tax=Fluviicola taffensis (strain DSM 16823 / NCIMB 13979 / RW262) TaxID=755732 RepID=F2ICC8_FLUTR|nr:peptide MFS transporter [Fluviicola taffensis]AEA44374.1 amino acid/peptide transporter [Fluviicola taffensis DSM 16823]
MKQRKHPQALPFLFLSEMWERFGYYLMIGIFTFYLKDSTQGFEMSEAESASLYGTFIALVFFTPFIGGLLADRVLGYRVPIVIGGLLMGVGYCMMGIHSYTMLYSGMVLVILGNGLFKPNISTLLGNLYNKDQFINQKDEGYNIFYMGINIGAFVCNIVSAFLINKYGYSVAFIGAGVGMFIGVIVFLLGNKHYTEGDVKKVAVPGEKAWWIDLLIVVVPAILFAIIGYFINGVPSETNEHSFLVKDDVTDAFLFACIPVIFFFGYVLFTAPKHERRVVSAILVVCIAVIPFWAIFKQNGTVLNTWANNYTNRDVPSSMKNGLKSMYLADTINYSKAEKPSPVLDKHFRKIGKEEAIQYPSYFKNYENTPKLKEGEQVVVFNSNIFQSVNPFWVIVLTPLIVGIFRFLRLRKLEPSIPIKFVLGLFITGLSCLVMVAAANASMNGEVKSSYWWFFGAYGVITIGELCLSPIGLSMVSKLSPARLTALLMGAWFISTSIGNKLSGVLASLWDEYDDKASFFMLNFYLMMGATLILIVLLPWLLKVFREQKK